jgi:glycosyltransferase involved in cell wall biosynthesis
VRRLILHAIPILLRAAGTSVFCAELCEHLTGLGAPARLLLPAAPGADAHPTPAGVGVDVFTPALARPDVIHVHAVWHPFLHRVTAWGLAQDVPIVVSPHGMLTPWSLQHRRLKKWLALAAYQRSDLVAASLLHATSSAEIDDIRRLGLRQPVVLAPLGVDVPDLALRASEPGGETGRDRMLLFVSRVHPKKGLVNLVHAWAALGAERAGQRWHLVIAGPDEGGHRAELESLATRLGLSVAACPPAQVAEAQWSADITFTGLVFDHDKAALYRRADLFVLPSHSENFGVVVPEALAAGVPVITTKGTPWQELEHVPAAEGPASKPSRAGWWIDIGVKPLQKALREALSLTDAERAAMGASGVELVRRRFGWKRIAADMLEAYQWLMHGGPLPSCVHLAPHGTSPSPSHGKSHR